MRRSLLSLCVLALVLGGCGRGAEPTEPMRTFEPSLTASSPSAKPKTIDSVACTFLTSDERRSIAGERMDVVIPVAKTPNRDGCRWVRSATSPTPRTLEVITMPAREWVRGFPRTVDQLIAGGNIDHTMAKRLLKAKSKVNAGGGIADADACKMFSLQLEARTGRKNQSEAVGGSGERLSSGSRDLGPGLVALTCSKDRVTTLTYAESGLEWSPSLARSMLRLLKLAHKRAVKIQG